MNYSLGNMLSRGGALNPDGLSLDLAFALDKTLTARKGPTPTFTRASTATFVGSDGLIQSAAINAPRFDHDPETLACKGLLIEESRTNLCLRSEEFNDGIWAKSSAIVTAPVVTANQVNSPSGVLNADRIVFPAVIGAGAFSIAVQLFSQSAGVVYTASIYLRGLVGGEKVWWSWTPNGSTYARKECILTTAWQRFDFTYTSTAGNNFIQLGVDLRDASQSAQLAQTIFAWGAQLETGSFPTSYIPTTTTALTRSADVCSITGSDFAGMWQSATAATILLEADASAMTASTSGNRGIATLSNGAAYSNQIGFYKESGTNFIRGRTPTVNLIQVSNLLGKFKGAIAIDSSTAGCFNGGTVITGSDNIGTVDRLTFADATLSPAGHPSVCISRYQIYRKRLPDAKLQSLTTL